MQQGLAWRLLGTPVALALLLVADLEMFGLDLRSSLHGLSSVGMNFEEPELGDRRSQGSWPRKLAENRSSLSSFSFF